MKLQDVSGVYDYAGPTRDSRYRPRRFAFHQVKSVGVLIASFRSSIPSPPVPLFTLRRTPHDVQRKTRGRVVRYSFLVGLLHSLLHADLSRRTDLAITRSPSPRPYFIVFRAQGSAMRIFCADRKCLECQLLLWAGTNSQFDDPFFYIVTDD